jgi:hypothetical protein
MAKNWKDVENRGWSLSRYFKPEQLPVRICLHASKTGASLEEIDFIRETLTREQWDEFAFVNFELYRGKIIGEVTVVDEVGVGHIRMTPSSPWFFGPHGFFVRDGVLYDKPVPMRGQLGFFKVSLTLK